MTNLTKTIKTSLGTVYTFAVDSETDLNTLTNENYPDICIGSIANVLNEGLSYILNSSNEWVKQGCMVNYSEVL